MAGSGESTGSNPVIKKLVGGFRAKPNPVATSPETDALNRIPRETLPLLYQWIVRLQREITRFPPRISALDLCSYPEHFVGKLCKNHNA
jgi:hypothetical protein